MSMLARPCGIIQCWVKFLPSSVGGLVFTISIVTVKAVLAVIVPEVSESVRRE